jgi:hypothetical protein
VIEKQQTWADNWNDVVRDVLFPDAKFKDLMLIPPDKRGNIKAFIEKYFVEDVLPDELITDEDVRILYYETEGTKYENQHVIQKYLEFDIYVRNAALYTATSDRLRRRDKLIFQRLKELLTGETYICNLRFRYEDDYPLGAKTVGYRRYHAVFSYKQTN